MVAMPDNIMRMVKHPDTAKIMATVSPSGEPHMIICGSLTVSGRDIIVVGEAFMFRTSENLESNPFAEFVIWKGKEAYSIKTHAVNRLTSGPEFDKMHHELEKMHMETVAVWLFEVDEIWDEGISQTTGKRLI